jgi:hypothetical protein
MTTVGTGRRMITVDVVTPLRSRAAFVRGQLAIAAAYVALFVCAALPTSIGTMIAALAVMAAEFGLLREGTFAAWALDRIGLGPVGRGLLRGAALVMLAGRSASSNITVLTAAAVTLLAAGRALHLAAMRVVTHLRKPPVAARGFDLELPPLPGAPAPWLTYLHGTTAVVDWLGATALSLALTVDRPFVATAVGWTILVALTGVGPAVLSWQVWCLWRADPRRRIAEVVHRRIDELQPEVVVYLGNGAEWRYQLEMWLQTLESMNRRILLVVREHEVLRLLAPTSLPLVSIPSGSTLMTTEFPGLRAVLYVGNTANNLHLLRRPGIRSVFLGHGDSDKGASANPFARAYHEIWVAGPAGRDRYAAAGVELPDSAFVEIGRPQLRELPRRPDPEPGVTVLYAPTWEGWGEDAFHSSLPHTGPAIVRALLARGDVRVMYRPHPRTGHVDPAARRAHLEILQMLRAAGAVPPAEGGLGPPPAVTAPTADDLLDELAAPATGWSRPASAAAVEQWTAAFWTAHPGHRILTAPAPDLHACFEMADALIADISSVPTDFLATNRPYAIVNCTDGDAAEFQERSATARGGFVLGADLVGLDDLVHAAGAGPDPTAVARKEARDYLLGPRTADPAARFREELDRICSSPRPGA